jgi:hypothetical protein
MSHESSLWLFFFGPFFSIRAFPFFSFPRAFIWHISFLLLFSFFRFPPPTFCFGLLYGAGGIMRACISIFIGVF